MLIDHPYMTDLTIIYFNTSIFDGDSVSTCLRSWKLAAAQPQELVMLKKSEND